MAKPIPVEVRQRIVEAFDQGHTREEIAELYNVGPASITRFLTRRRETGNLNPSPRPGRPPVLDENADEHIRGWIKEKSDLTLKELKERLEATGYPVGLTAIFDKLKRLMLPYKKKPCTRPNGIGPRCAPNGPLGRKRGKTFRCGALPSLMKAPLRPP